MAIVTSTGFLIATHLFFLTLIVVGFIRFRKPESGPLIIPGFIGLALCVFIFPIMFYFDRDSITSFDNYVKLMNLTMSPIALFMPAIILFILFILGIVKRDHKYSGRFRFYGGAGALILFFLLAIAIPGWVRDPARGAEVAVQVNIHEIHEALERYAVNNGLYPERIEMLIDDGYLDFLPGNPFIWQTVDVPPVMSEVVDNRIHPPMKNVPYGSPDFQGNFTYLPVIIDDWFVGYYLIGYGYKKTTGQDLLSEGINDHVIIVVDGSKAHPPVLLPSVQDVILESQSSD